MTTFARHFVDHVKYAHFGYFFFFLPNKYAVYIFVFEETGFGTF